MLVHSRCSGMPGSPAPAELSPGQRRELVTVAVPHVFVFTAEAKAAEAAASAYYSPGNPHNVYMPTVS